MTFVTLLTKLAADDHAMSTFLTENNVNTRPRSLVGHGDTPDEIDFRYVEPRGSSHVKMRFLELDAAVRTTFSNILILLRDDFPTWNVTFHYNFNKTFNLYLDGHAVLNLPLATLKQKPNAYINTRLLFAERKHADPPWLVMHNPTEEDIEARDILPADSLETLLARVDHIHAGDPEYIAKLHPTTVQRRSSKASPHTDTALDGLETLMTKTDWPWPIEAKVNIKSGTTALKVKETFTPKVPLLRDDIKQAKDRWTLMVDTLETIVDILVAKGLDAPVELALEADNKIRLIIWYNNKTLLDLDALRAKIVETHRGPLQTWLIGTDDKMALVEASDSQGAVDQWESRNKEKWNQIYLVEQLPTLSIK